MWPVLVCQVTDHMSNGHSLTPGMETGMGSVSTTATVFKHLASGDNSIFVNHIVLCTIACIC